MQFIATLTYWFFRNGHLEHVFSIHKLRCGSKLTYFRFKKGKNVKNGHIPDLKGPGKNKNAIISSVRGSIFFGAFDAKDTHVPHILRFY